MPITPKTGSLFHAETQTRNRPPGGTNIGPCWAPEKCRVPPKQGGKSTCVDGESRSVRAARASTTPKKGSRRIEYEIGHAPPTNIAPLPGSRGPVTAAPKENPASWGARRDFSADGRGGLGSWSTEYRQLSRTDRFRNFGAGLDAPANPRGRPGSAQRHYS
jgi:hypothetical protein